MRLTSQVYTEERCYVLQTIFTQNFGQFYGTCMCCSDEEAMADSAMGTAIYSLFSRAHKLIPTYNPQWAMN